MQIPFNKPYISGKEIDFIKQVFESGKIAGDGLFTKKCHTFFEDRYHFKKALLTTSCTDALEMAAILLDIKEGDEIIMPSYTFVSTANPFILRGAKIVFADSSSTNPNLDIDAIEKLITDKTKAIIPVHYAGVACDMDALMAIADKYNIVVVEDAAQAIDSYYKNKPLGSMGHLAAFSFHETKNIISGEGGMLVINDERFIDRAEIIREKGTNRSKFFRGEVDKYGWVDIGSSFLPAETISAFLYAQCLSIENIQEKRKLLWNTYFNNFKKLQEKNIVMLPNIPNFATNNAHMFYLVCNSLEQRTALIQQLKENGVSSVFHYLSLHSSPYFQNKHDGRLLPNSDKYTNQLIRLPLFYDLDIDSVNKICTLINNFFSA